MNGFIIREYSDWVDINWNIRAFPNEYPIYPIVSNNLNAISLNVDKSTLLLLNTRLCYTQNILNIGWYVVSADLIQSVGPILLIYKLIIRLK